MDIRLDSNDNFANQYREETALDIDWINLHLQLKRKP